jgi:hypothetical protein
MSYRKLAALLRRAMEAGELRNPVTPAELLKWGKRRRIDVPPELQAEIERNLGPIAEQSSSHPFLLSKIATVVVGMAVDKYEHDPERRNRSARLISESLRDIGYIVSEETVRHMLAYYYEFVKRDPSTEV